MRWRLKLLLLLLLLPGPVWAAPGYVQSCSDSPGVSGTSAACTLAAPVTPGHGVVVWVRALLATITSLTDDQSNSFTTLQEVVNSRGTYKLNVTNSPQTFTLTVSPADVNLAIIVHEVSGVVGADCATGQSQTDPGTGTDAVSSGPCVTSSDGVYAVGFSYDPTLTHDLPFYTAGTGFTKREEKGEHTPGDLINIVSEDRVQPSAGSLAATFTYTSVDDDPRTMLLTFTSAGGGSLGLLGVGQ
jgi:hypothetical protein